MEEGVLRVDGMSCNNCAKKVTNALGELFNVENIKVDLKGSTVSFAFEPTETPLEKIKEKITIAGYTIL